MQRRSSARIGVVLLIVIIAIVLISGIVFLAQSLFGGGGGSQPVQSGESSLLTEPTDNTTVAMSVRGPVTAREHHYDIQLEISATKRLLFITTGYDNPTEVKRIELDNDKGAFTDLLLALNAAGYTSKAEATANKNDGLCATGQLITFTLKDGDETKSDVWTTSCASVTGDFAGHSSTVIQLLLDQIPGSRDAIRTAK